MVDGWRFNAESYEEVYYFKYLRMHVVEDEGINVEIKSRMNEVECFHVDHVE